MQGMDGEERGHEGTPPKASRQRAEGKKKRNGGADMEQEAGEMVSAGPKTVQLAVHLP